MRRIDLPIKDGKYDIPELHNIFYNQIRIKQNSLETLITKATELIKNEPNVVTVKSQNAVVFGDVHGQYLDFNAQMVHYHQMKDATLIMLGDYIDREIHATEILVTLLCMKCNNPDKVHMIRGNHEGPWNKSGQAKSFLYEIMSIYNMDVYKMFLQFFQYLPIGIILETGMKRFFMLHGCIYNGITSIEQINNENRILDPKLGSVLSNLLWSDPYPNGIIDRGIDINNLVRGTGYFCSKATILQFMQNNNIDCIVRGHECVDNGYVAKYYHDPTFPSFVTLFSAPHYHTCNYGGVMLIEGEKTTFKTCSNRLYKFKSNDPIMVLIGTCCKMYNRCDAIFRKFCMYYDVGQEGEVLLKIQKKPKEKKVEKTSFYDELPDEERERLYKGITHLPDFVHNSKCNKMKIFTFNPLPIVPKNYAEIYNNEIIVKAVYTDLSQEQKPKKRIHTYASFVEKSFVEHNQYESDYKPKRKEKARRNSFDETMRARSGSSTPRLDKVKYAYTDVLKREKSESPVLRMNTFFKKTISLAPEEIGRGFERKNDGNDVTSIETVKEFREHLERERQRILENREEKVELGRSKTRIVSLMPENRKRSSSSSFYNPMNAPMMKMMDIKPKTVDNSENNSNQNSTGNSNDSSLNSSLSHSLNNSLGKPMTKHFSNSIGKSKKNSTGSLRTSLKNPSQFSFVSKTDFE